MGKRKIKHAEVPYSVVASSKGTRLDAGYYLGVDEEREVEKVHNYVKRQVPSTIRRLYRVYKDLFFAKLRVFKWRITGKIRYR